jgi:hypothetical protein
MTEDLGYWRSELAIQGLPPLSPLFCIRDEDLCERSIGADPSPEYQRIMKTIHYVPPVVVLIIASAWLTYLRGSNSALEQSNRALQREIAESRNSPAFQNERARTGVPSIKAQSEEKSSVNEIKPFTDWVSTSRNWSRLVLFINDEAKYRYTPAWARLEKLASEMSADELEKAYAEMTALAVHAPLREDLEWVMLKE